MVHQYRYREQRKRPSLLQRRNPLLNLRLLLPEICRVVISIARTSLLKMKPKQYWRPTQKIQTTLMAKVTG